MGSLKRPRRFRTRPVIIAGCGQVGQAMLAQYQTRDFTATYRSGAENVLKADRLRHLGARPVGLDLSKRADIQRLAKLGHRVIWMAAPNPNFTIDQSLRWLILALSQRLDFARQKPEIVYISTTGVYGDAQGNWLDESSPTGANSARAKRRVQAEDDLKKGFRQHGVTTRLVRAPGIYSATRLPTERLKKGLPALLPAEDSFSNHIHELDLARIAWLVMYKARAWDIINAVDQAPTRMGDYFDQVAEHFGLPKAPRLSRQAAQEQVSPMMWSFMQESRKIRSKRLGAMGIQLRYPTVAHFLSSLPKNPS